MNFICLLITATTLAAAPTVHTIRPGEDPQAVMDRAAPGDHLVFLPGLHQHGLKRHRSLLYVDKSVDIELQAGATLRLNDHVTTLEKAAEITTDHGAPKTIDDLMVGGDYDLGLGSTIYSIRIDSQGRDGQPDTFTWGHGNTNEYQHHKVPITGDWQPLNHGIQIRFPARSGHTVGSLWFLSYDGPVSYGIRIGHGLQPGYIDGVRIFGKGTIDLNSQNNVSPSGMVKDINATILVHGRVRNVAIEGVTMMNTMRSVMLYGEHTGKFLQGGGNGPGESFDAENISIERTRTINPNGSGYLLGHPSHRGRLSKVRCNYNYMETLTTSIEPNFRLDQYEVIGNVIKSQGRAIHCWRKSTNGLVKDNVRIDDTTGLEVVMVNAPGAWEQPENIILRDNRNHQSEPVGYWANLSGGINNAALGAYSTVTGGRQNEAAAPYSQAQGWQAKARRPGEDALAGGAFAKSGDAQTSQLVARGVTNSASPVELLLAGNAPIAIASGATVAYRILIAARGEGGQHQAAFECKGMAHWNGSQVIVTGGSTTPIHRTAPDLNVSVEGGMHLRILARGHSSAPLRWVARIELTEVEF
jgi:hypothetical protein